jgi:hypothetical protein
MPRPSDDPVSAGSGALKRIATDTGKMPRRMKRQFARFVQTFCEEHIQMLSNECDLTVENWLDENRTYSAERKDSLRETKNNYSDETDPFVFKNKKKMFRVNNFIKDEPYPEYKYARMINSRTDSFKIAVGPIFAQISKLVFGMKFLGRDFGPLIKYVPVADRPVVLRDLLTDWMDSYQVTDYSSFEAHFTEEIMETCEFQMYKHCTAKLRIGDAFMSLLRESMARTNVIKNKWFTMMLKATRMSGEMNTSLGNGFSNLMFTLFAANQTHVSNGYKGTMRAWIRNYQEYVKGVFEGDDGLAVFHPLAKPTTSTFTNMGLIIKLQDYQEIGLASFCGNLFDPVDLVQVTDPREVVCNIGWSNKKYVSSKAETRQAILRCKANSYLHQYPGCPIIQSLALYILRVTEENQAKEARYVDNCCTWMKEQYRQAYDAISKNAPKAVPRRTRLLVERLFQLSIEQQLALEKYFDTCQVLQPIPLHYVEASIPETWKDYYAKHAMQLYDDHPIVSLDEKRKASDHVDYMSTLIPSISKLKELI